MPVFPAPPDPLAGLVEMPTLDTERLRLRMVREEDAEALFDVFGDADVTRYWSHPPLRDLDAARALVAEIHGLWRARTLLQWGIATRTDDRVVGTATLAEWNRAHRRAEIGFALGRAHWKRGYVAEALPAVCGFGFERMGLHRIEADTDPRNEGSIRALERLGFRREGHLRQRYFQHGEHQDALVYGLLAGELEEPKG